MLAPPTLSKKYSTYEEVCTTDKSKLGTFLELPDRISVSWNPKTAFGRGEKLGKGSFGLVKKVDYKGSNSVNVNIALKEMSPSSRGEHALIRNEISALDSMGHSRYAPRLFGCHYDSKVNKVYMAQELLNGDLDSKTFTSYYRSLSASDSISLIIQIFEGLRDLWKVGYAHVDLKPANMMHKNKMRDILLIDFGLAQQITENNVCAGTPIFMSPPKFTGRGRIEPRDDMYSAAVSVAVLEAAGGYDEVLYGVSSNDRGSPRFGCFKTHNNKQCRDVIKSNVRRILQKAKYGVYQDDLKQGTQINLNTFISNIIEYDNFNMDYDKAIETLKTILNFELTNEGKGIKKIDVEEEEAIKKDLVDINKLEEERLALALQKYKAEQEYKALMEKDYVNILKKEAQNKPKIEENKNDVIKNMRENLPIELQIRLNKKDEERKKLEFELAQLKKNLGQKKNLQQNLDKGLEKRSQLYKEDKDLFKRKKVADNEDNKPALDFKREKPVLPNVKKDKYMAELAKGVLNKNQKKNERNLGKSKGKSGFRRHFLFHRIIV